MTVRLSTTVGNIEKIVSNKQNGKIMMRFLEFMQKIGTSERYQNNNLKAIIAYSKSLEPSISLDQINCRNQITSFLDTKIKTIEQDPDKRWITTWNDYPGRIK
jgi:integrase/recombinase XerD